MKDRLLFPRAPGVEPLLGLAAGTGVGGYLHAADLQRGDLFDEGLEGRHVEVGEPAAVAHAVVVTELEAEVEDAAGLEGVGVLGNDGGKVVRGHVEQAAAGPDTVIDSLGLVLVE